MLKIILLATAALAAVSIPEGAGANADLFQQGQSDRAAWEAWFTGLDGEYKTGADYWSGQRSLPHPGSCYGVGHADLGQFTRGCTDAQQRLAAPDALRKSEPDYRQGWNSYGTATTPVPRQMLPAFEQGAADRRAWEDWFNGLSGEYREGAEYWAGVRSKPEAGTCRAPARQNPSEWTAGCAASRHRLAMPDVRRKTDPDYRLGWNGYPPSALPPAQVASAPPAVPSTMDAAEAARGHPIAPALPAEICATAWQEDERYLMLGRAMALRVCENSEQAALNQLYNLIRVKQLAPLTIFRKLHCPAYVYGHWRANPHYYEDLIACVAYPREDYPRWTPPPWAR